MKKIILTLLVLWGFGVGFALAQTKVTGKITSDADGQPIGFATINVKGTNVVVTSKEDGTYAVTLPAGSSVLVYSFIGFHQKEVPVDGKSVIDVSLVESAETLDEVVVTTGYITEKRKNVSGSVTNLRADELQLARVDNLQRAMEGKAAGVQIVSAGGLPGSAITVNIRGVSSLSAGTEPLYIIDGVQVTSGDNSNLLKSTNAIAGINPDDIESIDILKDGASASIYGAQAANGVVIIKTKRGQKGKTKISFATKFGVDQIANKLDVLDSEQFLELTLTALWNRYKNASAYTTYFNRYKSRGWISGNAADFPNIAYEKDKIPNVNWMDAITRSGFSQDYQLNISGGSESTSFFLSGNYNTSDATTIFNNFNRGSIRLNLDHKAFKWLDIKYSGMFSSMFQRQPNDAGAYANPIRSATMTNPTNLIYNEDGTYNTDLEGGYTHNIVMVSEYNFFKGRTNRTIQSVSPTFHILKGLNFSPTFSIDVQDISEKYYYDARTKDGQAVGGRTSNASSRQNNVQSSNLLTYATNIGEDHFLNLLLGFEYKNYSSRKNYTIGIGMPTPYFQLLSQAAEISGWSETFTGYKMASLLGRVGYTYKNKYIVNAVLRRDGSSRFGENKRFGYFPSVSVAWRAVDEPFVKKIDWINDLKLKASYGITGNSDIGNFVALPQFGGLGSYSYNGSPSIYPLVTGNKDLTWESKYSLNIGLESSLFANRVNIAVDLFRDDTKDLLYKLPIPGSSGYFDFWNWDGTTDGANIPVNGGSLRNEGIELSVGVVPLKYKDFSWDINSNFSWIRNKVLSLYGGKEEIIDTYRVGEPASSYVVYNYAGVNPADGRPMYYSKNGDITYNPISEDRVWINGKAPTFFGGVTNTFSWKGLELSILFQFQAGAHRYFSDKTFLARAGSSIDRNQLVSQYTDHWKKPGDVTWVPQPLYGATWKGAGGSAKSFYSASSLHYEKNDFIKLKNVQLAYTFPRKVANKLKLEGIQMSLSAYNLWTSTSYTGFDPEFIGGGSTGTDFGLYPQSKNYTFTLKLDF